MENNLWLTCFFDLFKLGLVAVMLVCAYIMGYQARCKEERDRRYEVPRVRRRSTRNRLH